jgi:hypothetical protein
MQSGTGPESHALTATFGAPDLRGINEEPFTANGLMRAIEARGELPPRMIVLNTTVDYLSLRASLARTGAEGMSEQPIPDNARVYDIAGASHVVVSKTDCKLPPERLDWSPVNRATLLSLDAWVARNALPPASRLMPLAPSNGDPNVLRAPAHLGRAVIAVPQRDQDGNPLGGVRLPDLAVPLGTHAGQNLPLSFGCMAIGSYLPFARTVQDRDAVHDERASLAERYRDRNDYVNRNRAAARELEGQGFLLPADAAIIVHAAAETSVFK